MRRLYVGVQGASGTAAVAGASTGPVHVLRRLQVNIGVPFRPSLPSPSTTYFCVVSPLEPDGPARVQLVGPEMPISAPRPYSKPSANCVLALTITLAESTSRRKRWAWLHCSVTMLSV